MNMQTKKPIFEEMNRLYQEKIPFFFIVDFCGEQPEVMPLTETTANAIFFTTPSHTDIAAKSKKNEVLTWKKLPFSKVYYAQQFAHVKQAINEGNTYLLNLTCSTLIKTNYDLEDLYKNGESKYKLWYKDKFVHFSPEPFIQIKDGKIFSFPMKGTIDASIPDAEQKLLANKKELSEQYTIVDLIRNDLSQIANNVQVEAFRYIEKITTNQKELLAMSSKISGKIKAHYLNNPGDLFAKLLPAGSITGAPKEKTVELIHAIETHHRNYYTGVWGIYDGQKIDSSVIIRYIEKTPSGFHFKSGGGITNKSNMEEEYQEMIDKIYVPIF